MERIGFTASEEKSFENADGRTDIGQTDERRMSVYTIRRACKLILSKEYNGLQEALKRLNILPFDQTVFLNKVKIMYKVRNNLAPSYLQELIQMRDVNLNNTASNLRSVRQKNYILPQATFNLFKGSLTFPGVVVWNSIPLSIKTSQSLDVFVKRCSSWINY